MSTTPDPDVSPYGVARHSGSFAQIPAQLLMDRSITADEKLVYGILACHANQHSICWPKLASVGLVLGIKEAAVCNHISSLVAKGWIVRGQYTEDRRRNAYRLIWSQSSGGEKASRPVKQKHQTGAKSFSAGEVIQSFSAGEVKSFSAGEVKNILSREQTYVHVQGSVSASLPEKRTEKRVHAHAGTPHHTQKLAEPEEQSQEPAPLAFTLNAWTALTKNADAVAWLRAHGHNPDTWRYTDMLRAYTEYWEAHP